MKLYAHLSEDKVITEMSKVWDVEELSQQATDKLTERVKELRRVVKDFMRRFRRERREELEKTPLSKTQANR